MSNPDKFHCLWFFSNDDWRWKGELGVVLGDLGDRPIGGVRDKLRLTVERLWLNANAADDIFVLARVKVDAADALTDRKDWAGWGFYPQYLTLSVLLKRKRMWVSNIKAKMFDGVYRLTPEEANSGSLRRPWRQHQIKTVSLSDKTKRMGGWQHWYFTRSPCSDFPSSTSLSLASSLTWHPLNPWALVVLINPELRSANSISKRKGGKKKEKLRIKTDFF